MLQNSLARLFEGMATALHERVLPALDDDAVAAQVRAMVELLGNLSTRVTWDPAHLVEVRTRTRAVLALAVDDDGGPDAAGRALSTPEVDPLDAAALQAQVAADMEALGEVQDWLATVDGRDDLRRAVDDLADWHLDQELSRLRSARFGRP